MQMLIIPSHDLCIGSRYETRDAPSRINRKGPRDDLWIMHVYRDVDTPCFIPNGLMIRFFIFTKQIRANITKNDPSDPDGYRELNTPDTNFNSENNCKAPDVCPPPYDGRDSVPWTKVRATTPCRLCKQICAVPVGRRNIFLLVPPADTTGEEKRLLVALLRDLHAHSKYSSLANSYNVPMLALMSACRT